MTRGIVIGGRIDLKNGFSMNGSVDSQDLLRWLLYWDHITYTGIGMAGASFSGNHSDDILFLESTGIFKTEIVDISTLALGSLPPPEPGINIFGLAGNQFPIAAAAARVQLSNQLSVNTGDIWSIGQSGGEQLLLPDINERKELIDVQLVNCLPVPNVGTSFEDILQFKDRYKDELTRLRLSLDRLREAILSSADERRATDAAIHQISSSLSDVQSALRSAGIKNFCETIALYTNNPSLTFWTTLGGLVAASKGLPVELGATAGLALPTLCRFLKRSVQGGQNLPNPNSDFAYVYEVTRQLK